MFARGRFLAVYLLALLFPIGVWLGLLGYEVWSFIFLICGWTPIATYFAMVFSSKATDDLVE